MLREPGSPNLPKTVVSRREFRVSFVEEMDVMSIIAHAKGATHRQRLRTSRSTETQDIPLCAHMNLTPAATGGVESMDMPLVETLEECVWPEDEPMIDALYD